jgi:acetyl esterase/lipase
LDYEKVMVTGDSAGGYMALMSALTQPGDRFKVVLAQYPMTNYLRREPTDTVFGQPTPGVEVIQQHISSITPGTTISSAIPPARFGLSYALSAYDQYLTYFGSDPQLWPIGMIEDAKSMPPTWIIHGEADTAVEVRDSQDFVEKWISREVRGEVRLSVVPGMEHGFDIGMKETEEDWLREGLEWVEGKWLA